MGNAAPSSSPAATVNSQSQQQGGGCPVKHIGSSGGSSSSSSSSSSGSSSISGGASRSSGDECPVRYKNPNVYNVYSQKLDPTNQMPTAANQLPAPNQQSALSKERVVSSIPKGGTDSDTWLYPSPQMFWNALVRKDKTEGASEVDIDAVIAVHNNMNENTWKQVLTWEELHPVSSPGGEPKLLRFQGRPDDLSPKARAKMLCGHPAPFDRHDWVVDRGGREVRYVIDYYHDESGVGEDAQPKDLHDTKSIRSIHVDVRPALDSVQAAIDRIFKMPALQARGQTAYNPPPFFPPRTMIAAESHKVRVLKAQWEAIQRDCARHKDNLRNCKSEQECGTATVGLQKCTAGVVCPDLAQAFEACVVAKGPSEDRIAASYSGMVKCLELFEIESRAELRK